MKKILIDARFYGSKHTGLGRYTKNLLIHLAKTKNFHQYKFLLIVNKSQLPQVKKDLGNQYQLIATDIPHYSIKEQLALPRLINRYQPDLVHFTHFNKPILYNKLALVTVHDLIKHFYKGKQTTTRTSLLYWLKYVAYLLTSQLAIKSSYVIVPSNFWRHYLINHFNKKSNHIITTHEAVDPNFLQLTTNVCLKPKNYIIYTGNLYPHKNCSILFQALKQLPTLKLKIICTRDIFQQRAQKQAKKTGVSQRVEFLGFLADRDFKKVYQHALALVHPSFMEGFSLTGLEAMSLNCPVISSHSSCLPEIYQKSVLYFDPNHSKQLVNQIKKLQRSTKLRRHLIEKGHRQIKKYSWHRTAQLTIDFYQKILYAHI